MAKLIRNKRAQGISLHFIVIAAIAVLVLVLIVAFTVGGLGTFFRQMLGSGTTDLQTVQSNCQVNCNQLGTVTSKTSWNSGTYCTKTYNLDIDGDGKVGGYAERARQGTTDEGPKIYDKSGDDVEVGIHCWQKPISISCDTSFVTPGGTTVTCETPAEDEDSCSC